MGRRGGGINSSEAFELFLDTASNAFGGIVFISLLVCILLQLSGKVGADPDKRSDARKQSLELKLKGLTDSIATLEVQRTEQDALMKSLLGSLDQQGLVIEYEKLSIEQQKELAALLSIANQRAELTKQVLTLKDLLERLRNGHATKAKLVKDADDELRKIKTKAPGGTAKKTEKSEVGMLLAAGRYSFAFKLDDGGGINVADVDSSGGGIRPRAGRGTRVSDDKTFRDSLNRDLSRFSMDKYYIAIAIWPDSYREWQLFRSQLKALGFEFNPIAMDKDEVVRAGSGGPRYVLPNK